MQDASSDSNPEVNDLHAKLERKIKELDILGEILGQIRMSRDLQKILDSILYQLDHYFGFDHSMILLSDARNTLKVVASHGYDVKGIGAKVEAGKGMIGTAASRKKIIRVNQVLMTVKMMLAGENVTRIEDEVTIKLPGLKNPNSQVAIPLLIHDELIGVLSVESEKWNVFKSEDEHIIGLIAHQAAIAIKNHRLFESERQHFEEIETINKRLSDLTLRQQHTLNVFSKFVPEQIVRKTLQTNNESLFVGEQHEIALLFCDIRDFTSISEKLTPAQVVMVLNTFYSGMSEVIKPHDGVILQYTGDEIFVIFGAPSPLLNPEEKAVCCAIHMMQQLDKINQRLQELLGEQIKVGIGINYGPVICGNLGCEDKMSYSVTGDSVNTAKRIESLTKEKPNSILISQSVYDKTAHLIEVIPWEEVSVKGKHDKMQVYEVVGLHKEV